MRYNSGVIRPRRIVNLRVGYCLVAERLVVDFDRSEVGIERMASEDMIQHLLAAMVQDAPTPVGGHRAVEHNEALRVAPIGRGVR